MPGDRPRTGMTEPNRLSARDAAAAIAKGDLTPYALVEACLARIAERESHVSAWTILDKEFVSRELTRIEGIPDEKRGAIYGLPVAIKDIYDTADLPTAYGSPIYQGHRPAWDAACVARARAAGAVILGKTVTTEFAYWTAGKTRNPLDLNRTPGGSSSGSAAAVADFMVPLATGSQTVASTVRPAAYCGITGFKPGFGLISMTGVKTLAESLDTAGILGRSVGDVALLAGTMAGRAAWIDAAPCPEPPSLRMARTPDWNMVADEGLAAVETAAHQLEACGAALSDEAAPELFRTLSMTQNTVLAYEAARDLASEWHHQRAQLSEQIAELIADGLSISTTTYDEALAHRALCATNIEDLFGGADFLLAPATTGEAPPLENGTGDPVMSRAWTLLGLPILTIPYGEGPNGLPLGLQIAAPPGRDTELLAAGLWIEEQLA